MAFRPATRCLLIGILLAWPTLAAAETAQEAYARGKGLLVEGKVEAALDAFAVAARADQGRREYSDQYMLVRRMLLLRQRLDAETEPQRWQYAARALHALYSNEGMLSQAVSLGETMHAKLNDASSAVLLAETQLALNQNKGAAEVLSALDAEKATAGSRAVLGIALARQGKRDEARQIAKKISLTEDDGPQALYAAARLHAVTGNSAQALTALRQCLESVPPSRTASYQHHARLCPEFASLAASGELAKVLQTPSKIPQSACSGGTGCANCPMRGNCAKNRAQEN